MAHSPITPIPHWMTRSLLEIRSMQAEAQWYLSTSRLLSHAPSMKTHEKALLILISNLSDSLWDLTDLELRFLGWDNTARSPETFFAPLIQNVAITLGYLTSECLKLLEHERASTLIVERPSTTPRRFSTTGSRTSPRISSSRPRSSASRSRGST
jgi:hypothetical protein